MFGPSCQKGRLSQSEIERMLKDAEAHKAGNVSCSCFFRDIIDSLEPGTDGIRTKMTWPGVK